MIPHGLGAVCVEKSTLSAASFSSCKRAVSSESTRPAGMKSRTPVNKACAIRYLLSRAARQYIPHIDAGTLFTALPTFLQCLGGFISATNVLNS